MGWGRCMRCGVGDEMCMRCGVGEVYEMWGGEVYEMWGGGGV